MHVAYGKKETGQLILDSELQDCMTVIFNDEASDSDLETVLHFTAKGIHCAQTCQGKTVMASIGAANSGITVDYLNIHSLDDAGNPIAYVGTYRDSEEFMQQEPVWGAHLSKAMDTLKALEEKVPFSHAQRALQEKWGALIAEEQRSP